MSRIGRKPVPVPSGVEVKVDNGSVKVKGKQGELVLNYHPNMTVKVEDGNVTVSRPDDQRLNRALHGLTRNLINNMVQGVQKPFEIRLELWGVGYNATLKDNKITLQVGFANSVSLPVPAGVTCEVFEKNKMLVKGPQDKQAEILIKGADKQAVGQFAANIRRVRPPEPYKGKGVRYSTERVRRKAGKADAKK